MKHTGLFALIYSSLLAVACDSDSMGKESPDANSSSDAAVAESVGIKAIIAGEGLTGGGDDGEVALALDTAFTDDRYLSASALPTGLATDIEILFSTSGSSSTNKSLTVECPADKLPIGGGVRLPFFGGSGFVAATTSTPLLVSVGDPVNGWRGAAIEVNGGTNQSWGMRVYAICATLAIPPTL